MEKWLNSITTSLRNTWSSYGQTGYGRDPQSQNQDNQRQDNQNRYSQRLEQEAMAEERRKIVETATKFDSLTSAGYDSILQVLTEKVNSEIAEATRTPLEPETQRVHVIRWNAMRELLDAMINHVNDTMNRRDEIQREDRMMEAMGRGGDCIRESVSS